MIIRPKESCRVYNIRVTLGSLVNGETMTGMRSEAPKKGTIYVCVGICVYVCVYIYIYI